MGGYMLAKTIVVHSMCGLRTCLNNVLGYEPADLTVHPPPQTIKGGFIFFA